ncbi:hypothetical protein SBI_02800 [Streptomyces bingchenggensis BCW-1]|uniref:Uncharacterized protein n=1 Tax=Streptomyces bingchenggensis (strain BCW-1) TaxID=749414 RepID=D7C2N8_STRBB|nr:MULTISPECIES: hypothetical protein [Streptomyces]ADI05921.1 hypothetical protein SBI_02800 [Streptomyces bingchenggensis BCW-1]
MADPKQVVYDFNAADALSKALGLAYDKITALAELRAGQRTAQLEQVGREWRGGKRQQFDSEFNAQQAALGRLAKEVIGIQAKVNHATDQANKARAALLKNPEGN